jgi:serine/threonine protein kinase
MMGPLVTTAPALPASSDPTEPGAVLAGKYCVTKILGKGGMGVVVEARHIALDDRVAIKFLLPEYAQHPEASVRFLREAKAARKIKSEHVAHVIDVDTLESGAPYMVMEFLEGQDLAHMLETTGVLPIHDAVDFVIQGCEAIAEAHKHGIIHRDIKPANLFLMEGQDGLPTVKVLDFGISKTKEGAVDNLTRTQTGMGSAHYMSPEQMVRAGSVDLRTDIYALGIALYELLAGTQPFHAETWAELHARTLAGTPTPLLDLRADVPAALALVLERAYARERVHRYASVAELVIALAPFAPPRSYPTIERIARMAGVPLPDLSQSGAHTVSQAVPAATQLLAVTPPPYAPAPPPVQPPPPPAPLPALNQILPGPYQGPVSTRAAANFAQGAAVGVALSAGRSTIKGAPNRAGALVLVALAVLAMGGMGIAVVMALGRHASPSVTLPQPSAEAPSSASASASATAQPPDPTATAAPAPSPAPSPSVSASRPPDDPKPAPADHHFRPGPAPKSTTAPAASMQPKDDGSLILPESVYGTPKNR